MPRPVDVPRTVADGPSADRILLIGSHPSVGWGVTSHQVALPGALARAIRQLTSRGVVVDVRADPLMVAGDLASIIRSHRVDRYDAVVITVGVNDAVLGTTDARWADSIDDAITAWGSCSRRGSRLFFVGVLPISSLHTLGGPFLHIADARAEDLSRVLESRTAEHRFVSFVALPASGPSGGGVADRHSRADYAVWAAALANVMVSVLRSAGRGQNAMSSRSRAPRARHGIGVEDPAALLYQLRSANTDLDRLATAAATAFGAPMALVTVLGADRQWHAAAFGTDVESLPIEQSFCRVAVGCDDSTTVVSDVRSDSRLPVRSIASTDHGARYYAGSPIEHPDGRRIGTLCVLDAHPRDHTTDLERVLLRKLAARAEEAIWEALLL